MTFGLEFRSRKSHGSLPDSGAEPYVPALKKSGKGGGSEHRSRSNEMRRPSLPTRCQFWKTNAAECRDHVEMTSRDQIVSQAQVIFREVLDSPDLILSDELTAPRVPGWDSLNHVTLVMTLEEHFKVKFTTREVMGWRNVGQMLDCLQTRLNSKGP